MKTKDIMEPLTDYLRPDHTIKEAVNLLPKARRCDDRVGVKELPVLDPQGRLLGILSMGDILKVVYPFYMPMMNLGGLTWEGMMMTLAKEAGGRTVDSAMTREVVTVNDDNHLMKSVDLMLKHKVHSLPVLDASGKVVGTVYERDLFYVIVKAMLDKEGGPRT